MDEILNMELAVSSGAGLVLLGFGFIVLDYFMARSIARLDVPEWKITDEELLLDTMPDKEKCRVRRLQARQHAILGHRMRRGALFVVGLGCCILLAAWLTGANGN
jgi:hypothetical protein